MVVNSGNFEEVETINQRIARFRKFYGYSQGEMAYLMGLKVSTYSQFERKGKVTIEHLVKCAQIFDIDITVLIYGYEQPQNPPDNPYFKKLSNREINMISVFRTLSNKKKDIICEHLRDLMREKE